MRAAACICVLAAVAGLWSCAGAKSDEEAAVTISGRIVVIGNEPFTALALSSDPSTTYRIEADEKVMKELGTLQGRTVEVTGKVRRGVQGLFLKVETFVVH